MPFFVKRNSEYRMSPHCIMTKKTAIWLYKRAGVSASLTVEASIVIPLFVFAVATVLNLFRLINFQTELNQSMYNNARMMAKYAYVYEMADTEEITDYVVGLVTSDILVGREIAGDVNFLMSSFEDDIIDMVAVYQYRSPFLVLDIGNRYCVQRMRIREFIGVSDNGIHEDGLDATEKVFVYVTPYGTVYHTDENCSHISLTVSAVLKEFVDGMRNKNGGKYYPCELCYDRTVGKEVFITDYGDRYHSDIQCGGIKRGILKVTLESVRGMEECKRCRKQ